MKMLFTKWAWVCSALLFFGMFSLNTQNANAQVLIEQGFDATATPANWTYVGFTRVAAPNAPCAGLGSLRRNLWTSTPTGSVAAPLWTSNGDNINVTFDFKLLNWQGTLSPANVGVPIPITGWGSLQLQLSTDADAKSPRRSVHRGVIQKSSGPRHCECGWLRSCCHRTLRLGHPIACHRQSTRCLATKRRCS